MRIRGVSLLLLVTLAGCSADSSVVDAGREPSGWQDPVALGTMTIRNDGFWPNVALTAAPSGEVRVAWRHQDANVADGSPAVHTVRFRPSTGWGVIEGVGTGDRTVRSVALGTDGGGRSWLAWLHADGVSSSWADDGSGWSAPERAVDHAVESLGDEIDESRRDILVNAAGDVMLFGNSPRWSRWRRRNDPRWTDSSAAESAVSSSWCGGPGGQWSELAIRSNGSVVASWSFFRHGYSCSWSAEYRPGSGWSDATATDLAWPRAFSSDDTGRMIGSDASSRTVSEWRLSPGTAQWGGPRALWAEDPVTRLVAWNADGEAVFYAARVGSSFVARVDAQGQAEPLQELGGPGGSHKASVAIGAGGDACAVWRATVTTTQFGPDVRAACSRRGGAWSISTIGSMVASGIDDHGFQSAPVVVTDSLGRVTVVWTELTGPAPGPPAWDVATAPATVWAARYVP